MDDSYRALPKDSIDQYQLYRVVAYTATPVSGASALDALGRKLAEAAQERYETGRAESEVSAGPQGARKW